MIKLIIRGTALLQRLLTACLVFRSRDAFVLIFDRRPTKKICTATIRSSQRKFYYRGITDYGVMSHFYEPGYRIVSSSDPIEVIIDCGANIGDESVIFACLNPKAKIFAIEPEESNYEILCLNAKESPNIIPVHAGLWSSDAMLRVSNAESGKESFRVVEDPQGTISARSLGALVAEYSLPRIDILKMDIEGAEFEVFSKNYAEWLPIVRCMIIESADSDRPGTMQRIYRAIDELSLEFNFFISGENLVGIRSDSSMKLVHGLRFG